MALIECSYILDGCIFDTTAEHPSSDDGATWMLVLVQIGSMSAHLKSSGFKFIYVFL